MPAVSLDTSTWPLHVARTSPTQWLMPRVGIPKGRLYWFFSDLGSKVMRHHFATLYVSGRHKGPHPRQGKIDSTSWWGIGKILDEHMRLKISCWP